MALYTQKVWSTKLQKIDLVTSQLFLERRGGGGSSPRRWGPAPNQLIGIDSTFHTYARLMGQISAEQRGREAAKQLYVTGRLQTAMVRSRQPGCPGRNWFDFVTKCRAKLCFKTENEDLCFFLFFPLNLWKCLHRDLWQKKSQDPFVSQRDVNVHTKLVKLDLSHVTRAAEITAATTVHTHLFSFLLDLLF